MVWSFSYFSVLDKVSLPQGQEYREKRRTAWEIWPAAPTRLAHAPPRRTQVIPIPHIGRTTSLPADLRLPQDRKRKEGRTKEGEYLDIHLSGFRGLCRRFLSRLSQTEVAISGGSGSGATLGGLIFSRSQNSPRGTTYVKKVPLRTLRFDDGETKCFE